MHPLRSVARTLGVAIAFSIVSGAGYAEQADSDGLALRVAARSGVDRNFELLLANYAPATMTGRMVLQECGPERFQAHLDDALLAARAAHGERWLQGNAAILEELVTQETLQVAVDYPAPRIQTEVFGGIEPSKLKAALDSKLQPIVEDALAEVLEDLLSNCTNE